jgi:hypothetical protein
MLRTVARLVMLAGAVIALALLAPLAGASAHRQAQRCHNESCVKACRKQESLDARQAQLVHLI